jgi:hypothetical protein
MATDAPTRPKGKGLNGKIGPVPVKVAIFVGAALLVFLYLRHRAASSPSSAGTGATPSTLDNATPFPAQPDATGGGSSGGTSGPAPGPQEFSPPPDQQPFNFYFSPSFASAGGGNTSPPQVASSPSIASTAHPPTQTIVGLLGASVGAVDFNPGSYNEPQRVELPDTVSGSYNVETVNSYGGFSPPPVQSSTPPKTATSPYTVSTSANKSGGSANKKQGVFSVH